MCQGVFTLVTRGRFFLTSASKLNMEPNGEIFDVSPENDRASPNVKTISSIGPIASQGEFNLCVRLAFFSGLEIE